jgi:hypothetical protein
MKLGLLAASLVLVAGAAVGCGGNDHDAGGSGAQASTTKEFCGALKDFQDTFAGLDPTHDLAGYVKTVKAAAEKLAGVGTPKDMPPDARDGFDLTVQKIKDLPDDATTDDLAHIGDVTGDDKKKLDALDSYVKKTCPELSPQTGQ